MANAADWVSAVASVVGVVIGIIILFTVYIGAMQLLSQKRAYRLGLSWRSIGPWKQTMARWALFGLQRRISTPVVNLKLLVEAGWEPNITFPAGFPKNKGDCVEKGGEYVQAKASWVNFMQALGMSPETHHLYEMQDASDPVNDVVPMSWRGRDLAGICSILGFRSCEEKPSFRSPMPLPMQWSGPLGWLQFQSSGSGCVAEFRRRMDLHNQIASRLHQHAWPAGENMRTKPNFLRSRLWHSINGFALPRNRTLYLGGTDRDPRPQEAADDDPEMDREQVLQSLTTEDLGEAEILNFLFGAKKEPPKALHREAARNKRDAASRDFDMPDFLDAMLRDGLDESEQKQVFRPCPGLLSVDVHGELAYNRGLSIENSHEYDRKFMDAEDVDHAKYPHNLGDLYMDKELLGLVKEALLMLQPDGFYFSPTHRLYRDLCEAYQHVEEQSNTLKAEIFPQNFISALQGHVGSKASAACCPFNPSPTVSAAGCPVSGMCQTLCVAMELCNDLQRTRKTARACFTVEDMGLLAKATSALLSALAPAPRMGGDGRDLVWALLYCRELLPQTLKILKTVDIKSLSSALVVSQDETLNFAALFGVAAEGGTDASAGLYDSPLVANAEFTAGQVVAAVCYVLITYYWIEKRWLVDVAAYDTTMPQSVMMC